MRNIKIILSLCLYFFTENAFAKEQTLLGKVKICKTSALLQCEVIVKKSEFQAKSGELADMQLTILTAEKTLHVPISKYSLQIAKQDIHIQIVGLISKKKDQEKARNVMKKDQYVVLVFKEKHSQADIFAQSSKKKDSSAVASVSGGSSSPLMKKKTMRTPAKKGNLLHESVNQLSPGRESRAPEVEYGGPSTYADIDYTH